MAGGWADEEDDDNDDDDGNGLDGLLYNVKSECLNGRLKDVVPTMIDESNRIVMKRNRAYSRCRTTTYVLAEFQAGNAAMLDIQLTEQQISVNRVQRNIYTKTNKQKNPQNKSKLH